MEEEKFQILKEKVRPSFEGVTPCHDFSHTERVLNLAIYIGKKENADLEVIKLSALLHDIARKEEFDSEGKICHAEKGAELAKEILKEYNLDKNVIDNVIHCIETHRFRRGNKPETKEAKVLSDADKLDSIGAVGIARAFSFSGHIGSKIHNSKVDIENTKEYSDEDTAYREFMFRLSKLSEKMLTEEGKRIAKERHEFMENFFNRLNKEWEGEL